MPKKLVMDCTPATTVPIRELVNSQGEYDGKGAFTIFVITPTTLFRSFLRIEDLPEGPKHHWHFARVATFFPHSHTPAPSHAELVLSSRHTRLIDKLESILRSGYQAYVAWTELDCTNLIKDYLKGTYN